MCNLIKKYNVPGPRYTSYPTVPYWDATTFSEKKWKDTLQRSFRESNEKEGISLYIHLPFCESLCTFCACHKRITKQHHVEVPYIESVLKEWQLYCDFLSDRPIIKQLHLGGGTPSFFSPKNLKLLIKGIFKNAQRAAHPDYSFEGHPNNTTRAHLQVLYDLGFRRVSFGVQDYNVTVQKAIHRIQPFGNVKKVTEMAREIGYASVGHDLIFGLPHQTVAHIRETIEKTKQLLPDRLAFYSYAHVPWIKGNGQRGFKDTDLPKAEDKRRQYETGKRLLQKAGYHEIGMDHFALPSDSLYKAATLGGLHRNFMGYTDSHTQTMIGLGVSSIGDSWYGFAQNVKGLKEYQHLVENDSIPIYRGHILTPEDLTLRQHILNLMCIMKTSWGKKETLFPDLDQVPERLREMELDELVKIENTGITVTPKGKPFIRNVCMAFDMRLHNRTNTSTPVSKDRTGTFSMTV